jgi:hypothetical protein
VDSGIGEAIRQAGCGASAQGKGTVSAAQVDRILAPRKVREGKGRCGTKPGGVLKTQILIHAEHRQVDRPGYLEANRVAYCGESLGQILCGAWSVTYIDIASGWNANRAVWNQGS